MTMLQSRILYVHSYLSFLSATHSRVHQVHHGDWQELIHPKIQNTQFLVAVGGTGWPLLTLKCSGRITVQGGDRYPHKILCVNTDQNFNIAAHYTGSFYFTLAVIKQKPTRLPAVLQSRTGFTDMGVACCPPFAESSVTAWGTMCPVDTDILHHGLPAKLISLGSFSLNHL